MLIDFENNMLSIDNREGSGDMPPFKFGDHESRKIPLPVHTMDILIKWQNAALESVPYIFLTKERYEIVKAKVMLKYKMKNNKIVSMGYQFINFNNHNGGSFDDYKAHGLIITYEMTF